MLAAVVGNNVTDADIDLQIVSSSIRVIATIRTSSRESAEAVKQAIVEEIATTTATGEFLSPEFKVVSTPMQPTVSITILPAPSPPLPPSHPPAAPVGSSASGGSGALMIGIVGGLLVLALLFLAICCKKNGTLRRQSTLLKELSEHRADSQKKDDVNGSCSPNKREVKVSLQSAGARCWGGRASKDHRSAPRRGSLRENATVLVDPSESNNLSTVV